MAGGVLLHGGGGGGGLGVVDGGEGVLLLDVAIHQPVRAAVVEVPAQLKQVHHGDVLLLGVKEMWSHIQAENIKYITMIIII